MRVNDVVVARSKYPLQLAVSQIVAHGTDGAIEMGSVVDRHSHPRELVGQRARLFAHNLQLEPAAVEMLERLEHRALGATHERKHLNVANSSHGKISSCNT